MHENEINQDRQKRIKNLQRTIERAEYEIKQIESEQKIEEMLKERGITIMTWNFVNDDYPKIKINIDDKTIYEGELPLMNTINQ